MSITRDDLPPDIAAFGDVFVDTYDESKIYIVSEDYNAEDSYATLTIPAEDRATAGALVFTALDAGFAGTMNRVAIARAGASGTSELTVIGDGTRDNPRSYEFSVYDDDNTNAALIALLSGDTHLSAAGDDPEAETGQVTVIADTSLTLTEQSLLVLRQIKIQYDAEHPGVFGLSDEIPAAFPLPMRNALAEYLASRLANMNNGGDIAKARFWLSTWQNAVDKSRSNQHANAYPRSMRPG